MSAKRIAFPVLWRRPGLAANGSVDKGPFSSMKPEMTELSPTILSHVGEALCAKFQDPHPDHQHHHQHQHLQQQAVNEETERKWRRSIILERMEEEGLLGLTMRVGRVQVPLTLLGSVPPSVWASRPEEAAEWLPSSSHMGGGPLASKEVPGALPDEVLAVHSPGLPGAVLVPLHHVLHCRAELLPPRSPGLTEGSSSPLGAACLLEAVRRDYLSLPSQTPHEGPNVLEAFYRLARRRHFSLRGMERMMAVSDRVCVEALDGSFPYHCGGTQARKEYFDIHDDVLSLYAPHFRHGGKLLSRYGLSTCVGVRAEASLDGLPAVYWHPSGAPAACIAPLLHSCGSVVVGQVQLEYNGPTAACPLIQDRDASTVWHYVKLEETEEEEEAGTPAAKPGAARYVVDHPPTSTTRNDRCKQKEDGDVGVNTTQKVSRDGEEARALAREATFFPSSSAASRRPFFVCDTTEWLTTHLFGVKPGAAWSGRIGRAVGQQQPLQQQHHPQCSMTRRAASEKAHINNENRNIMDVDSATKRHPQQDATAPLSIINGESLVVHGTNYNADFGEFELFVRGEESGVVYLAADV